MQAWVEQSREREIEQAVGRLRLVWREKPGRVILLSNLPTGLIVDRLIRWDDLMPPRLAVAAARGNWVLPLSRSELTRLHPDLWENARAARWDLEAAEKRTFPVIDSLLTWSLAIQAGKQAAWVSRFSSPRGILATSP